MSLETITLEELQAKRPDLVKALKGEQTQADELEQIKAKLEVAEAKLARVALEGTVAEELTAAGLDRGNKQQVSDVFWKQLVATESADDRKALIADRASLVKEAAKSTGGASGAGKGSLSAKPVTTTGGTGEATESVGSMTAVQFANRVRQG